MTKCGGFDRPEPSLAQRLKKAETDAAAYYKAAQTILDMKESYGSDVSQDARNDLSSHVESLTLSHRAEMCRVYKIRAEMAISRYEEGESGLKELINIVSAGLAAEEVKRNLEPHIGLNPTAWLLNLEQDKS